MISTGIKYIDRLTGGFKLGDNVVWQVSGGVPVEIFIKSFFSDNDSFRNNIIYVNFNYSPQTIYKRFNYLFNSFDTILVDAFTYGKGKGDQVFLDFYRSMENGDKERFVCLENPGDIKSFMTRLNEIENKNMDGAFYIFDSLTGMNELWKDETAVLDFFSFTCPKLYNLNTLAYWIYELNAHSKEFIASLTHITQIVFSLDTAHSNYFEFKIRKLEDRSSYQTSEPYLFRIIDENIQFQERKSESQIHVGAKVKELRRLKKITQSELAASMNMTPGGVSQIENDIVTPSLQTLIQLSSIFKKPMDFFISSTEEKGKKGYEIYNKPAPVVSRIANAGIYKLCDNTDTGIDPYLVILKKGKSIKGQIMLHKGKEFIHIIKGSVYISLDGDVHYLKEGDSLLIETAFIEKIDNKSANDSKFIYILL